MSLPPPGRGPHPPRLVLIIALTLLALSALSPGAASKGTRADGIPPPTLALALAPAPGAPVDGLFQNYTAKIATDTLTLPDYSYNQFQNSSGRPADLFGNAPVLSQNNVYHEAGLFYLSRSMDLVFYSLATHSARVVTHWGANWIYTTATYYYGLRSELQYWQLPNGSLYDVYTLGQMQPTAAGPLILSVYCFYTGRFVETGLGNLTGDNMNFYQIANDTFWWSNVHGGVGTGASTVLVAYTSPYAGAPVRGNQYWPEPMYRWSAVGLSVSDQLANSPTDVQGFPGLLQLQVFHYHFMDWVLTVWNNVSKRYDWRWVNYTGSYINNGTNGDPAYVRYLPNGTAEIYQFAASAQASLGVNTNYAVFGFYMSPTTLRTYGSFVRIENGNFTADYEMNSNDGILSTTGNVMNAANGFKGDDFYPGNQNPLGGSPVINYLNDSKLFSTNTTFNRLFGPDMRSTANNTQHAFASTDGYEFYQYSALHTRGKNDRLIVFWLTANTTETFAYGSPGTPRHLLAFAETGLPSGATWSVTVGKTLVYSDRPTLGLLLPPGTYGYTVTAPTGFRASLASGNVLLSSDITVPIGFDRLPGSLYSTSFRESGLPSATPWAVLVAGTRLSSQTTTISEPLANGSYPIEIPDAAGYRADVRSLTLRVAGSPVEVLVRFAPSPPTTYSIGFHANGLPNGTAWSVSLGALRGNSTSGSISFGAPNGTYAYRIAYVRGYTPRPASGFIRVAGQDVGISVAFTPLAPGRYTVAFLEEGLTNGTNWSVTLDHVLWSSLGPLIVVALPNGTATFAVGSVTGFTPNPANGTLVVNGSDRNVTILFTSASRALSASPAPTRPALGVLAVGVGAGLLVAWVARRRPRRDRPGATHPVRVRRSRRAPSGPAARDAAASAGTSI